MLALIYHMHGVLFGATTAITNPITNGENFLTSTMQGIVPLVVAILGFFFLLRHKIRDLIVLLVIGAIVYSLVADPQIISNLASFMSNTLGI